VWIDYNVDGDFEDENELVFDPQSTTTSVSGNFTVPPVITEGVSRARVSMTYTPINSNNEPASCGNLTYGEIEDFCISLSNTVSIAAKNHQLVVLYPNPASEVIRISGLKETPESIDILSIAGDVAETLSPRYWPALQLPELPNGYYILRINSPSGMLSTPLMIAH
jgi:hypothetical protein